MGKLGIMDLLSFAKAGYSPKDVKELLEMDIPEPSPKLPEVVPEIMEQKDAENAAKEPAQVLPSPIDNAGAEDIDYKKLYEEEAEKVKQLLINNREFLDAVIEKLYEKKTISYKDLKELSVTRRIA